MLIGEQLRLLREYKNLTQGDIEKRSGMMRSYISRVENGHTVPAVETLEKFAQALEVPLYVIFYEADQKRSSEPVEPRDPDARQTRPILEALGRLTDKERRLLFFLAETLAARRRGK